EHQPDRTLPQNDHEIVRSWIALHHRFEAGVERFHQGGAFEGDPLGNSLHTGLHDPIHHPHVLGEASAGRLEPGGDSHLFVYRALSVDLTPAVEALAARDEVKSNNPISQGELSYPAAHGGHDARSLVRVT